MNEQFVRQHIDGDLAEALTLLAQLTDADDCAYDHHGGCQVHMQIDGDYEAIGGCPNAQARRLLARYPQVMSDD